MLRKRQRRGAWGDDPEEVRRERVSRRMRPGRFYRRQKRGQDGQDPFCRNGPEGAAHKRVLTSLFPDTPLCVASGGGRHREAVSPLKSIRLCHEKRLATLASKVAT